MNPYNENSEPQPENGSIDPGPSEYIFDTQQTEPAQPQPIVYTNPFDSITAADIRNFFGVTGPSILYGLSACCILFGISKIVTPVLSMAGMLGSKLGSIGALQLYELALVGVLLLIVLLRRATDDAVSLTVLIGLFLIATGIAIDSIILNHPVIAVAVGTLSVALAASKIWAMNRYISFRLEKLLLISAAILIVWNYYMPAIMAFVTRHAPKDFALLRAVWLTGWLVLLAGAGTMLIHSSRTATAASHTTNRPFFQSTGMAWLFLYILIVAASVHQYALTYIFGFKTCFFDFVPLICVLSLVSIEVMRNYGKKFGQVEYFIAGLPLFIALKASASGAFIETPQLSVGILWYPPVLMGGMATALVGLYIRNKRPQLLYLISAYIFGAILTAGITPNDAGLNWKLFGIVLVTTLIVLGIIRKNSTLIMSGIVILAFGSGLSLEMENIARSHYLSLQAIAELIAGLGTMLTYLIYRRNLPRWAAVIGASVLILGIIKLYTDFEPSFYPIISGLLLAGLAAVVLITAHNKSVTAILCLPLLRAIYLSVNRITGWHYVVLSFILLAFGAFISLRKGRVTPANQADKQD